MALSMFFSSITHDSRELAQEAQKIKAPRKIEQNEAKRSKTQKQKPNRRKNQNCSG